MSESHVYLVQSRKQSELISSPPDEMYEETKELKIGKFGVLLHLCFSNKTFWKIRT